MRLAASVLKDARAAYSLVVRWADEKQPLEQLHFLSAQNMQLLSADLCSPDHHLHTVAEVNGLRLWILSRPYGIDRARRNARSRRQRALALLTAAERAGESIDWYWLTRQAAKGRLICILRLARHADVARIAVRALLQHTQDSLRIYDSAQLDTLPIR